MRDPIFDLESWEPLFRVNENMVMDLDTGKLRFITPWKQGEDERDG